MKIEVSNYRRFGRSIPARFAISGGFTAFVGPNNAGKSSILRLFYEFRTLFTEVGQDPWDYLLTNHGYSSRMPWSDALTVGNDGDMEIQFALEDPAPTEPTRLVLTIRRAGQSASLRLFVDQGEIIRKTQANPGDRHSRSYFVRSEESENPVAVELSRYREFLTMAANAVNVPAFRHILPGTGGANLDIPVGKDFVDQWDNLLSGGRAESQRAQQVTDDLRSMFGFATLSITPDRLGNTLLLNVDGVTYRLEEMGGGISELLQVMTSVAMKPNQLVLIDEPELHLHPRLQLEFLTSVARYATPGVVFATHNLGLAREVNASIYSITPSGQHSRMASYGDRATLGELLGELSFGSSASGVGNAVLLVEGRTDILVFQQLLRMLGKGHHYVVLPLGGDDLINGASADALGEVRRITDRVYAVIDSERTSADQPISANRVDFQTLCESLGVRCHVLQRRATENYLSGRAIREIFGERHRELEPFESLNSVTPSWNKRESWRVAQVMTLNEWCDTDLGRFLESLPVPAATAE